MVGGIDKVIYLPAKLTEQLGYFKDEGLDVQLLTEPSGAQAENVLIAGDVQGVVGFYDHTVDLQTKGKCIESVVQFADVPGEVEIVATARPADHLGPPTSRARSSASPAPARRPTSSPSTSPTKAGVADRRLHDGQGRRRARRSSPRSTTAASTPA